MYRFIEYKYKSHGLEYNVSTWKGYVMCTVTLKFKVIVDIVDCIKWIEYSMSIFT